MVVGSAILYMFLGSTFTLKHVKGVESVTTIFNLCASV